MQKRAYTGITAIVFGVFALLTATSSANADQPSVFGVFALLAASSSADAGEPSVCGESYRGDPAYDRACLVKGVVGDAGALWYSTPKGIKGKEVDDAMNRRSICKYAYRHGGIKRAATELVTDLTYDAYTNHKQVNAWVVSNARVDCKTMGYRV